MTAIAAALPAPAWGFTAPSVVRRGLRPYAAAVPDARSSASLSHEPWWA
jgi:hypothetical protein